MASTDKKKRTEERLEYITKGLAAKFEMVEVNGEKHFHAGDNLYFSPFSISDWEAIGVEYAHGIREAILNQFADGDLFYLDEMDADTMLAAVLHEIEQ